MYQLDEETNEAHDAEANGSGNCDLLELLAVGLRAALDKADGVLGEEASRFSEFNNFVHSDDGLSDAGEEGTQLVLFIYFFYIYIIFSYVCQGKLSHTRNQSDNIRRQRS